MPSLSTPLIKYKLPPIMVSFSSIVILPRRSSTLSSTGNEGSLNVSVSWEKVLIERIIAIRHIILRGDLIISSVSYHQGKMPNAKVNVFGISLHEELLLRPAVFCNRTILCNKNSKQHQSTANQLSWAKLFMEV